MSLINDALKQARKTPPVQPPVGSRPPLRPVFDKAVSKYFWIVPTLISVLLILSVVLIVWAALHKTITRRTVSVAPAVQPDVTADTTPVIPPPAPEPAPMEATPLPTLQGIFYSPTAPMAILDGKTVGVGDQFREYRVKEITKSTATIVGPDGKPIRLTMSN